ncbi:isochorismatase hydrolase [Opitutaceae bacterium TAV5]|nr:isochorismatase hydrolase [Opitutaceae bacterium TAV5]
MNALLLSDIQNDFLPGGALAVPQGDAILPVVNRLLQSPESRKTFPLVIATQDWHPANHGSFAAQHPGHAPGDTIQLAGLPQILWPVHCVQHTPGAAFAPALDTTRIARVFTKGADPQIDSYSGFFDNGRRHATGLGDWLREQGVTDVCLAGLTTDYCVKFTALDAVSLGFRTHVIADACRGVNLHPDDTARALADLRAAGVRVIDSNGL